MIPMSVMQEVDVDERPRDVGQRSRLAYHKEFNWRDVADCVSGAVFSVDMRPYKGTKRESK